MKDRKIIVDAPCKINLHLDVKEKRADGFHNIESIFQLISLCDTLSASRLENDGECRVFCRESSLPPDNTISRAFSVFRRKTGIKGGASFALEKRVPAAAGLGGGSSDGAAALRALDALYGTGLSAEELEAMALEIGSDCPFFIRGGTAFVSGRGEELFRFSRARNLFGVAIWPAVNSSTKEAYSLLDFSRASCSAAAYCADTAAGTDTVKDRAADMLGEYLRPPKEWRFFNSFTDVLCAKYPPILKALSDLKSAGAHFCSMSGSGSAVFGIFEAAREAEEAFCMLSRLWQSCHKFFFLDFSPVVK